MIEPLFTASAPLWTTVPPTGFALQAPLAMGNGPIAAPIFGPSATPYSNALSFVGRDFGSGLSAPALLAAIAMRRGQPQGPTHDQEVEDFIYDVLEVLPGAGDVEVRCEGGRASLSGSVQHKRLKRDIGEVAWAIPALHDVQNNVTIASRRRKRTGSREAEGSAGVPSRKSG
jgi:hypothetical protein